MKVQPMWAGSPTDLVYHTVKHFLASGEREAWDRIPAGTGTAESFVMSIPRHPVRPVRGGDWADERWRSGPWQAHAHRAHASGYCPRYEFLAAMLGDVPGPRWERQGRRWLGDLQGFRLVVEPKGTRYQMISAFFSHTYRHDDQPDSALRAFRSFAARLNCPPAPTLGVPTPEKTS